MLNLASVAAAKLESVGGTSIQGQIDRCFDLLQRRREAIVEQLRSEQEGAQFLFDFMRLELAHNDRLGELVDLRSRRVAKVHEVLAGLCEMIQLRAGTRGSAATMAALLGTFVESLAMIGLFAA